MKNPKFVKISALTNPNQGWITPLFKMAITRQEIELEGCSGPLYMGKDL